MKVEKDQISYVLGQSVGGDFKRQEFDIDVEVFLESFKSAYAGEPSKMRPAEMQQIFTAFQSDLKLKQQANESATSEKNIQDGQVFLEENKKKKDIIITDSGLQYRIIEQGTGDKPSLTDTVETHYEGKTLDGNIFDSSIKRGTPATFPVNGVIKGWQEALQLMNVGSKFELFIPSDLAYGHAGSGGTIEPHATLIFEVHLLAIR